MKPTDVKEKRWIIDWDVRHGGLYPIPKISQDLLFEEYEKLKSLGKETKKEAKKDGH